MSNAAAVVSPKTLSVGVSEAPYKKYWWVVLLGFAATGLWLCLPMMGASVGSERVNSENATGFSGRAGGGLAAAAEGGVVRGDDGLSGASAKGSAAGVLDGVDASGSMLLPSLTDQTAGASASGGAVAASASPATLARALKNVGRSADPSGWGGQKPQRGFAAPSLSGGGLSGLGGISGGGGSSASLGLFGAHNAQVQGGAAVGLNGGDASSAAGLANAARTAVALQRAAGAAGAAAGLKTGDAVAGGMSRLFDGAKGGAAIKAPGGGSANTAYAQLNSAPVNLKTNPSGLNQNSTLAPPPAAPVPPMASGSNMGQQLGMMVAGVVVTAIAGGLVGGVMGQMVGMGGMMGVQYAMQNQQAAAANQQAQQQCQNNRWACPGH